MEEIIEVEGVKYRKVKRKAEVGDVVSFADDGALYRVNKLPTASEDDCLTIVCANQSDLIGHTAFADDLSDVTVYEVICNPHRELFAEQMGNEVGSGINGKLLRIYTGTDVEGDFHTHVTVGIDEATGVMYVLGMKTEVVE